MRPWEFYRLTAYEFERMMEGHASAALQKRRQLAWAVANLMNATGNFKELNTVDTLLSGTVSGKTMDMAKIRERAEQRRRERLALRGAGA